MKGSWSIGWTIPKIQRRIQEGIQLVFLGIEIPESLLKDPSPRNPSEVIEQTREALYAIGVIQ